MALSPARAMLPPESEAHFQRELVKFAEAAGYRVYHTKFSWKSASGFPDLCLVRRRDRRVIFAELKRDSGVETAAQREWLSDLEWCEQEVYTWRPRDWPRIAEILTREGWR